MELHKVFILRGEAQAKALWAFLKANWQQMADEKRYLAITVTEWKNKRSVEQNKRLWKILNEIAEQAWVNGDQYSADAWHEMFKRKFIGQEELPDGGILGISTTTLNVSEFGDYMTKIEAYAATELGLEIMV